MFVVFPIHEFSALTIAAQDDVGWLKTVDEYYSESLYFRLRSDEA
jgi:hypothetical protein